ncbi:elongation factor G [Actinomycetospora succinea]|uniref:Elongation factor G n=1 Tax=Actinomycetospora succinea TaxID=663603 RepID=A0A4R6VA15_9PSEU|nr:elongation factor G [Actinomycetospora succinea]TDQ58563.1 elongation factor G [Actinomycetospora succinea]
MSGSKAGDGARRGRNGRAGSELAPDDPAALRSVAIVGPMAAGKTTLVEELLAAAGAITRAGSVAAGTTVTDHDPDARRQQRSVAPAVASLTHRDVKINLVDTPGCPDFLAEVRAGLRAADAVLFVVGTADAADGVAAPTSALLAECRRAGLPAMLVLSRLDHARADEAAALATCREVAAGSGEVLVPVTRTERGADGTITVRPLLAGDDPTADDPDGVDPDGLRRELVETLIEQSEDEALLESWIGGEPVALDALRADLATAVARRSLIPVAGVCAPDGAGMESLLDLVVDAVPPPTAHQPLPAHTPDGAGHAPVDPDPDGPLVAEVVHTGTDAQGSRVSLVRVFSGRLRPDTALTACCDPLRIPAPRDGSHDNDPTGAEARGSETVRVNRVYAPLGATLREVPWCVAGDVCALTRLGAVTTGDTLCAAEDPVGLDGWELPEALLPVAVTAADRSAQDAMARGLARLAATETTLRVERNEDTHQIVLWCTGEAHADVVLARLRASGASVEVTDVAVPERETVAGPATGLGRHVKQSGGHGQFAVCRIEIEPLPRGSGVEFVDKIVGGVIPRAYIPGVEKGVRAQLEAGVTPGRPVVDVRVTLVDGKAHSVDSSDQAFQTAGSLAIKEAVATAGTVVMERLYEVEVEVDDAQLGAVLGDLASRHGRVLGTEPGESGHTRVRAEVPEQALLRYPVDLRALTSGTASFTRRFSRYEPVASG